MYLPTFLPSENARSFRSVRRTEIIGVQILAEVREAGPCEDEEVDLGDEAALLRAAIQRVPDDTPDTLSHRLLLLDGISIFIA